jgi:hypothetical protein
MFKFVRFDVKFSVHAVRTKFHSGRLLASVDYGTLGSTPVHKNAFYNNVLDFNGDNSVCEFVVPWNSTQEYIRTFENTGSTSSHSVGRVWISVLNELRVTSEVVPESVDVIVEVSFLNVKVAHPNSYSACEASSLSRVHFVAQGGADETQDVNETDTVMSTTQSRRVNLPGVCKLQLGSKFEHNVQDIHEVVRRYNYLAPNMYHKFVVTASYFHTADEQRDVYAIYCRPMSELNNVFAAWSGSLKFRIFADTSKHCNLMLSLGMTGFSNLDQGAFLAVPGGRMALGTATNVFTPVYGPYTSREVLYPIGDQSFIDVSVPFISEFNVMPTHRGSVTPGTGVDSRSAGTIFVNVPAGVRIHVYWAAGDDFRYSVYSPSRGFRVSTSEVTSGAPPTNGDHIAGMRYPPA